MSNIAMQGGATGTGTVTLLAPSTSTNRTLTLPDSTGTIQVSGAPISGTTASFSGDVTLGSSVLATPTGSAPSYTCRAWVNFNGTGTVAIRASGNVSSITDNGTGDYTVNFTSAMADANYAVQCSIGYLADGTTANVFANLGGNVYSTTAVRVRSINGTNVTLDSVIYTVAIFR